MPDHIRTAQMGLSASRWRGWIKWWVLGLTGMAAMPLFFTPGGGLVRRLTIELVMSGERALPLGFIGWPILLAILVFRKSAPMRRTDADIAVGFYVVICTAAFALSSLDRSAMLSFGQTIFPLVGYAAARLMTQAFPNPHERHVAIAAPLRAGFSVAVVALVLFAIQAVIDGRVPRYTIVADHLGPFFNTKALRFYPILVAMAATWFVGSIVIRPSGTVNTRRQINLTILFSGVYIYLLMTHARSAMLMAVAGIAMMIALGVKRRTIKFGGLAMALICAGLIVVAVIYAVQNRYFTTGGDNVVHSRSLLRVTRTVEALMTDEADLHDADYRKLSTWSRTLGVITDDMFGARYAPVGSRGAVRVNAEAGYLDVGLRAGLLAMFAIFGLIAVVSAKVVRIFRCMQQFGPDPRVLGAQECALLAGGFAAIVIGAMGVNLFTEPYVAPFVWYIIGAIVTLDPVPMFQSPPRVAPRLGGRGGVMSLKPSVSRKS